MYSFKFCETDSDSCESTNEAMTTLHSENRLAAVLTSDLRVDKENVAARGSYPSKAAMNLPPASSRKGVSKGLVESAEKRPAAAMLPRRALGDITNSAAPKRLPPSEVKPRPPVEVKQREVPASRHAAARTEAVAMSKAELYAQDGVEKPAGKDWAQLEAERKREEDSGINQRVKLFATALWRTPMGSLRVRVLGTRWLLFRIVGSIFPITNDNVQIREAQVRLSAMRRMTWTSLRKT